MSRRHKAREMAVQMLYQSDLGGSRVEEIFSRFQPAEYLEHEPEGDEDDDGTVMSAAEQAPVFEYAKGLVSGTLEHLDEVDALIVSQADNWRLERMAPVDRNILRLGVYEFLYQTDVPKLVVIDEAIELAKRYGSENSSGFVNGLLDGLIKAHSFPGSLT